MMNKELEIKEWIECCVDNLEYKVSKHEFPLLTDEEIREKYPHLKKDPTDEELLTDFKYLKQVLIEFTNYKSKLEHWLILLQTDGINSKKLVADEIKEVLE